MSAEQHLFVYGSLAKGQPNAHVLENIGGSWEKASVKGQLKRKGWGAEMGFPGLVLDENGVNVQGYVFSSNKLKEHWSILDAFEGDGYQRVETKVKTAEHSLAAYVYVLK